MVPPGPRKLRSADQCGICGWPHTRPNASDVARIINQRPHSRRPHLRGGRRWSWSACAVQKRGTSSCHAALEDPAQANRVLGVVAGADNRNPAMNVHKLVGLILHGVVSVTSSVWSSWRKMPATEIPTMISLPINSCYESQLTLLSPQRPAEPPPAADLPGPCSPPPHPQASQCPSRLPGDQARSIRAGYGCGQFGNSSWLSRLAYLGVYAHGVVYLRRGKDQSGTEEAAA